MCINASTDIVLYMIRSMPSFFVADARSCSLVDTALPAYYLLMYFCLGLGCLPYVWCMYQVIATLRCLTLMFAICLVFVPGHCDTKVLDPHVEYPLHHKLLNVAADLLAGKAAALAIIPMHIAEPVRKNIRLVAALQRRFVACIMRAESRKFERKPVCVKPSVPSLEVLADSSKHRIMFVNDRLTCAGCCSSVSIHAKFARDWIAASCHLSCNSHEVKPQPLGTAVCALGLAVAHRSHRLWRYKCVIYCANCGSWSASKLVGLAKQCGAPTAHGIASLKAIDSGKLPAAFSVEPGLYSRQRVPRHSVPKSLRSTPSFREPIVAPVQALVVPPEAAVVDSVTVGLPVRQSDPYTLPISFYFPPQEGEVSASSSSAAPLELVHEPATSNEGRSSGSVSGVVQPISKSCRKLERMNTKEAVDFMFSSQQDFETVCTSVEVHGSGFSAAAVSVSDGAPIISAPLPTTLGPSRELERMNSDQALQYMLSLPEGPEHSCM